MPLQWLARWFEAEVIDQKEQLRSRKETIEACSVECIQWEE